MNCTDLLIRYRVGRKIIKIYGYTDTQIQELVDWCEN